MRSIQRHLGLWILGASGLGALLLGLSFYVVIYIELSEAKDDGLKLVATSVADQGAALDVATPRLPQRAPATMQRTEIVVLTWSRAGKRLHSSNPRCRHRLQ